MRSTLGKATLKVLDALANGYAYGFDIMDATGLASGTVYPALSKLERSELVHSRWEDLEKAHREKRPPRRYYEITGDGRHALHQALQELRELISSLTGTVAQGEAS